MTDPIDPEWFELLDAVEAGLYEKTAEDINQPAAVLIDADAPHEPEKWQFVIGGLIARGWRIVADDEVQLMFRRPLPQAVRDAMSVADLN